jgi:hypothetical protein
MEKMEKVESTEVLNYSNMIWVDDFEGGRYIPIEKISEKDV